MSIGRTRQAFSLVELIVVVAIISVHAAEKNFFTEYGVYHFSFSAIGFSPEGGLRFV